MKFTLGTDAENNPAYGFEFEDMFITDPTVSECGRFPMSPAYYGLTEVEAAELMQLNMSVRLPVVLALVDTELKKTGAPLATHESYYFKHAAFYADAIIILDSFESKGRISGHVRGEVADFLTQRELQRVAYLERLARK